VAATSHDADGLAPEWDIGLSTKILRATKRLASRWGARRAPSLGTTTTARPSLTRSRASTKIAKSSIESRPDAPSYLDDRQQVCEVRAEFGPEGVSNDLRSVPQHQASRLSAPATGRFKLCKEHAHPLCQ